MIRLALILAVLAGPVAAQSLPFYAPCMIAMPDRAAYQNALERRGWVEATSEEERDRLHTLFGQIEYIALMMPEAPEDAAAFDQIVRDAAAYQDGIEGDQIFFRQGSLMARLSYNQSGGNTYVSCTFAASALRDVTAALGSDGSGMNDIVSVHITPPRLPPGVLAIGMGATRIDTTYMSDELRSGRDSLTISLTLPTAP